MEKTNGVSLRKNLGFLLGRCVKYDKRVFGMFVLYTLGCVVLPLTQVFLPKVLVAGLEEGAELGTMLKQAGLFALVCMTASGSQSFAQYMFQYFVVIVRMHTSEEFYERLMTMDFRKTEDAKVLDHFRLASEAFQSNSTGFEGVLHILFRNTGVFISLITLSVMLTVLHPAIVLLIFVGALLSFHLSNKARAYQDSRMEEMGELSRKWEYINSTAQDFSYGKDVRLYSMQKWLAEKYLSITAAKQELLKALNRAHVPRIVAEGMFTLLREGVVYGYLIYLYLNGRLMLSDFAMYFAAVASFSVQLNQLLAELARIRVELRKVDYARSFIQDVEEENGESALPEGRALGVELDNVSFAYPSGKEVLHKFSLSIKPGEKIAVVGLNGAGKTTLVKLLTRLYEPTGGTITIGGTDASRIGKKAYYRLFSVLFQEVRVFAMTVAENIAMKPQEMVDRDRAEACLKMAGLWDKIASLPKGMDTMLLKNVDLEGTELSGGQNQRLALARALYKDAPIVVLDEPTAALDPLAEAELYEKFAQLVEGRTAVFISHRLSSTRFCDRIILMEDGRIAEEGTHDELMALDGKYANLFRVQAQYYQESGEEAQGNG